MKNKIPIGSGKKIILFLLFTPLLWRGAGGEAFSQNLVPNPSFEDTISCPLAPSGPWNPLFSVQNWYSATNASLLYFNSCAPHYPGGNRNVPNNDPNYGWQYARTGVAYVGTQTYCESSRGYLQVELTDTLVTQHKYCVWFYVNCLNNVKSACNNMGMYFSDLPVQHPNPVDFIGIIPQIIEDTIIKDTVNWIKVSGEFIATG